jgi:hypothetical protein
VGLEVGGRVEVLLAAIPARALRSCVAEGTGEEVRVAVRVTVGVREGFSVAVREGRAVDEAVRVSVVVGSGRAVELDVIVGEGRTVRVAAGVEVGRGVEVEVGRGVRVGGSPIRVKLPDAFHWVPAKIRTSYEPGSQSSAGCSQRVKLRPVEAPCQTLVSKYFSSPLRYQTAVHWVPGTNWS